MRTTVTLDPDVEALVRHKMVTGGLSFKAAVNQAIRAGLAPRAAKTFRQRTFSMGFRPNVSYERALQIASNLEDEELLRKLSQGR